MVDFRVKITMCGHPKREEDPLPCGHLINTLECPDKNCEGYHEGINTDQD